MIKLSGWTQGQSRIYDVSIPIHFQLCGTQVCCQRNRSNHSGCFTCHVSWHFIQYQCNYLHYLGTHKFLLSLSLSRYTCERSCTFLSSFTLIFLFLSIFLLWLSLDHPPTFFRYSSLTKMNHLFHRVSLSR